MLLSWEERLAPTVRTQISTAELQSELRAQWDAFVAGAAVGDDVT